MAVVSDALHISRGWRGQQHLEEECPCPKEPCGYVALDKIDPECDQHQAERCKTIRDNHRPEDCPGPREGWA